MVDLMISNSTEKFMKASMMNTNEEMKCEECQQIIFQKEIFMVCQVKEFKGEIKLKNFCCDCFKQKIEEDIKRIRKWSDKNVQELLNMLTPIEGYMESDIKKQTDEHRKMIDKIEGEEN
jgi:hypothetical protein